MPAAAIDEVLLERGRWVIRQIEAAGAGVALDEVEANLVPFADATLEDHAAFFANRAQYAGLPFVVDEEVIDSSGTLHCFITNERGRRWDLVIQFEAEGDRRIRNIRLERRLPDGVEVRDATPEDGAGLAALYAATPMQAGDLTVTIDPGDDYFVMTRLMEHARTLVALEHGKPIGLYTGTLFQATLRGDDVVAALGCHTRIADGKAGGGLWSIMNTRMIDGFDGNFDVPLAFVLSGNTAASRLTTAGAWPAIPVRAAIPCRPEAAAVGRAATPDDAGTMAEILNATHGGHDLYRNLTAEDVARRLERAPDLYGWGDVWLHDGAVVGIGRTFHKRLTESPAGTERSVRALVYDYGALPGSEDALTALLAARGADAAGRGATHLSVFTCEAARLYTTLVDAAAITETYDLFAPGVEADDDAATRGIFVDQIHF